VTWDSLSVSKANCPDEPPQLAFLGNTVHVDALYQRLGRALRDARDAAGLTQREVAERIGLTRSSVANIERGSQHIALHQLFLLAHAVGAEPRDILPADDVAIEDLLPAKARKRLAEASPEEREFAVRLLRENERVRDASRAAK
jgi:transcriptional regulator with XRE-family HTH domain